MKKKKEKASNGRMPTRDKGAAMYGGDHMKGAENVDKLGGPRILSRDV